MAQRDPTDKNRLARETAALRKVFENPGHYEVRRPDGSTRQLFVLCRSPWRFARVGLMTEARDGKV